MKNSEISRDDIQDVMEMTEKLESSIHDILEDNETNLAMSALISATLNCIFAQCDNIDDIIFHRNLIMHLFHNAIVNSEIEDDNE